jgi:AcrR family transcriptional regulator
MTTTKLRLIQCAYELFGRNGFHAVGLDQIISEVGVSKQTFYNHFEGKDDLILAVLEFRHTTESATFDKMLTTVAGRDPRARLYRLFDTIEYWFSLPEWKGCIFMRAAAEFPSRNDPAHHAAHQHADATREFLLYTATLAGAANPHQLAMDLALLLEGVAAYHHLTGSSLVMDAARRISRQLIDAQLGGSSCSENLDGYQNESTPAVPERLRNLAAPAGAAS